MIYPNALIREFDRAAFVKKLQSRLEHAGCDVEETGTGFKASKGGTTHLYSSLGALQAKICSFGAPRAGHA